MEDECGGVPEWWPLAGLLLHGGGEGDNPELFEPELLVWFS